jgi:hypothetical protein
MVCWKAAVGAATFALGGLFLVACRTDAKGLGEPGGPSPPLQVERPDAITPPGPAVADTGAPPPVTSPPPVEVGGQADAAAIAVDAVSTAPDLSPPVDTAVGAAEAAGPAPTWLGPVVRAKEIDADTVVAQVIYAKDVEAEEAKVDSLTESKEDKRWEMGRSDSKIAVQSLMADVIYVEKIKCRRIEARELHAETVKIQRR